MEKSTKYFNTSIGLILRLLRVERQWSQENVADQIGMSLPGYSKIERNITDVSLHRLCQLAALYKIKVSALIALCEKNNYLKRF